jgi:hypothetical protein
MEKKKARFRKVENTGAMFEAELSEEAERLARTVGPVIDQVLGDVCP